MRFLLTLGGVLLALILAIGIFGERENANSSSSYSPSIVDEFFCALSGDCYWDEYGSLSEVHVSYVTSRLHPQHPGFITPPWAEPQPSEDRQERLQSLLTCSNEQILESETYSWPTERSLYWNEGSSPPPMMIERADAGDADTMFDLGFGYLSGHSDLEDEEAESIGFAWLLRAAEQGHMTAHTEVGAAYSFGYYGQNIDYPAAREHLTLASEAGDSMAMLSLALLPPAQGQDLSDYAEARLELELRSAELCYDEAIAHIVERLRQGRGLTPDSELASQIARRVLGINAIDEPQAIDKRAPAIEQND